ncbi:hypothetical protein AZI86_02130 [Bdellovibrio bacteriovorus]|uniref:Uncharacterized protein n=1 Tax=Bdellovibrio bacteriovorus TaxID=959 RepID=A0A150WNF4_BDEBC|nr:hypothetical protein [Bdellovibrio bacteriovorus]KYG65894.1 hypothetical protein AZI86_02130 [Bdellovibrio bacteriovorus]
MALSTRDLRYLRDYKMIYPRVLTLLELLSNSEEVPQRNRDYLFSPAGYIECTLDYDENCEYLKSDLRKGQCTVGCTELNEILRLNHMIDRLDAILNVEQFWKKDISVEPYLMSHPQWLKIENQARKTLDLLRKT